MRQTVNMQAALDQGRWTGAYNMEYNEGKESLLR